MSFQENSLYIGACHFCNEANRGNLHVVQKLYHYHGAAIVNAPGQHGWTALHYVSMSGVRFEILKYLVETCGANIRAVDFGSATPLQKPCLLVWYIGNCPILGGNGWCKRSRCG
jgi:ankyrin repeat protein